MFINCNSKKNSKKNLQHLLNEVVHELLTVAPVTLAGFVEAVTLGGPAALGGAQLEGGQEVVGLLEVGSDGVDLVDEVLHAGDAVLAEVVVDLAVVIERDALLVDATETALVTQTADVVHGRVTVGSVGLDHAEHVDGGLVDLDEDAVVHLAKTHELQDLSGLRGELVGTGEADNEDQLGLRLDEEIAALVGLAAGVGQGALLGEVLLLVLGLVGAGDLAEILVLGLDGLAGNGLLSEKLAVARGLLLLALREDLALEGKLGVNEKTVRHVCI